MYSNEPIIHVGIMSASVIHFVLNGEFVDRFGARISGNQTVFLENNRICFRGNYIDELLFEPINQEASFDLIDVVIGINFHWERKENQRFTGSLKFIVEQGLVTAINRIGMEDYLKSVISSEMSATASEELLKAHAVISRSWLLCPMHKSANPENNEQSTKHSESHSEQTTLNHIKWYERDAHAHFDVCADDHCQRYQGITRASTQAVIDVIEATRGEVLMYDGTICDARYSKSCGGVSETFENCWAPEHFPYLSKVVDNPTLPSEFELDLTVEANAEKWIRESPDAFCNTTDKAILGQVLNNYDQETTDFYRWKVAFTQNEIAALVARKSGLDVGQIIDLIPVQRGESGRLIQLKIVGSKQTVIVGKELEIRKWFSNSHLYSSAFVIDKGTVENGVPQNFYFSGAGWGHGVGLCQIGAAVMGASGYTYHQILQHYFTCASLERIY